MTGMRVRLLLPVLLISLCLGALGAVTAVSLLTQQRSVTAVLRETVRSRQAAVNLEEDCLLPLRKQLILRAEEAGPLHTAGSRLVAEVRAVADQPTEKQLADQIEAGYRRYLTAWAALPAAGPPRETALKALVELLDDAVYEPCREFRKWNGERLESVVIEHEEVLARLGWGLGWVGGIGALAGVVVGFGAARGFSRRITQLRVRLQYVADKLGPPSTDLVVSDPAGLDLLEGEMRQLTGRIEAVLHELQEREREVLRAEQLAAVGQLAAGVAHEIRNPLTAIKLLVQSGREDGPGSLTADDLGVIEAEVRRMERSLQTFLDFARPPKAERQPVDLRAVAAGVADLVRGRADKQRVAVDLRLPADPLPLTGDPSLLHQLFVNLALNALDAMPTGGTLGLHLRRAGDRIEAEVTDTGPGIPADRMPRLFQAFSSTKDTGLGLGLVISRRIAEDHGGNVTAANRPEGGACFTLTLPAGGKEEG